MKRVLLLIVALPALAAAVSAQGADAIVGLWQTEPSDEGRAHVRIYEEGGAFHGEIVWLEEPVYDADDPMAGQPKIDRENPEPSLRERPVLGLQIMEGFSYDGDGLWKGGTIYDPDNGKTYKCKMWLEGEDTLKVRGFIGFSLLGRNATWERIEGEGGAG